MSDHETGSLLPRGALAAVPASWISRWSVGDWVATLLLVTIGFHIDAKPPFEREIGPQVRHRIRARH